MEIFIAIAGAVFGLIIGYLIPKKSKGITGNNAEVELAGAKATITQLEKQISE